MAGPEFSDIVFKSVQSAQKKMRKQKCAEDLVRSMRIVDPDQIASATTLLPLYSFPLEFIFGMRGLPVHKILTITGPTNCAKSSFFWFLARQVLGCGGRVLYLDLEKKSDILTALGYVGNPMAFIKRVVITEPGSVEGLRTLLSEFLSNVANTPGLTQPILLGIDTLGTTTSRRQFDAASKGIADPGYGPAKAAAIAQAALQSINIYLNQHPITVVILRQERRQIETPGIGGGMSMGGTSMRATGGAFAGYASSFDLKQRRIGQWKESFYNRPLLQMSQGKNSGSVQRNIPLIVPTRYNRHVLGRMYSFCWEYSMVRLLSELPADRLSDIFKVDKLSEMRFKIIANSRTKAKQSAFSKKYAGMEGHYTEVGTPLIQDTELHEALRVPLDIACYDWHTTDYAICPPLDGSWWLGPEEHADWQTLSVEQQMEIHTQYMKEVDKRYHLKEAEKQKQEKEKEAKGT